MPLVREIELCTDSLQMSMVLASSGMLTYYINIIVLFLGDIINKQIINILLGQVCGYNWAHRNTFLFLGSCAAFFVVRNEKAGWA